MPRPPCRADLGSPFRSLQIRPEDDLHTLGEVRGRQPKANSSRLARLGGGRREGPECWPLVAADGAGRVAGAAGEADGVRGGGHPRVALEACVACFIADRWLDVRTAAAS